MIVRCPSCSVRFRLDRQRLAGKRVTLRCPRCRGVFQQQVPADSPTGNGLQVLVAHGDRSLTATIEEILGRHRISCRICHDGFEALRRMEEAPPGVVVADVALPGLYAFDLVEKIRSRPALEGIGIILLSSVYSKTAYKRSPTSLYGADDYLEKHHIPDDLVPKVLRLAGRGGGNATVRAEAPGEEAAGEEDSAQAVNSRIRGAEEKEVSIPGAGDGVEKARRLARIIVSDIALYNQDKVEEGLRAGNFFDVLAGEIEEGERLFNQRIPPEIAGQEDFLRNAFDAFVERRKRELRQ